MNGWANVRISLTLTTIRVPTLLESHVENLKVHGHEGEEIDFIVIGDRKTPDVEVRKIGENIKKAGYEFDYLDVGEQKRWLKSYPKIRRFIPYNTPLRRNLGYLRAAEREADLIVSLDDDNFASEDDFIAGHSIIGQEVNIKTVRSENSWFNPCSMLKFNYPVPVYMRGFPYAKRWGDRVSEFYSSGKVALNMGLWLEDPDVDAVTNLNLPLKVTSFNSEQIMLAPGTFAPINTQNTAFAIHVLPSFYCVPYGTIHGIYVGRYDDVWGGMFAKKVIDHMNERVTIGRPLTIHRRNPHNLLKDLKFEFWGMILTEQLIQALESIKLTGNTYAETYIELSQKMQEMNRDQDLEVRKFLAKLFQAMEVWAQTVEPLID